MVRTYSELIRIDSFEERYAYLALSARVGDSTFGHARDMNQSFYTSAQWRRVRRLVALRDNFCDLAHPEHEIPGRVYIHHMNPMTIENLADGDPRVLDPEYLITTTHQTHNAIHYGDERQLPQELTARRPGDTKLW